MARLRVTPELTTHINQKITGYLFKYIPWEYENNVDNNLVYGNVLDTDIDNMTPLEDARIFNTSNIHIPVMPDFTEREYKYTYFSMSDIVASIGGIGGAIKPVLGYVL